MTQPTLYTLTDVCHTYTAGRQQVHSLNNVTLEIHKGEFLALAGPSGSGKTTLLNVLGLLDSPRSGSVHLQGVDTGAMSQRDQDHVRRTQMGFIFQTLNLIPVLTAFENVEYFLLRLPGSRSNVRKRVMEALDAVGLADQAGQRPMEMSGGQRQRAAVARALVKDPAVVLADEPTASLDHQNGQSVIHLMKRMNQERGVTFIFSTHDAKVLAAADRVIHMEDGRTV